MEYGIDKKELTPTLVVASLKYGPLQYHQTMFYVHIKPSIISPGVTYMIGSTQNQTGLHRITRAQHGGRKFKVDLTLIVIML